MRQEMAVNRQNVELIENFEVINECADKYTNVDSDLITEQLDKAYQKA